MTLIYTAGAFGRHEVPAGHQERQGRYVAVEEALKAGGLDALERREAPLVTAEAAARAHPGGYWASLEAASPEDGLTTLDPDTFMGPHSWEATRRAAGAAVAAVDAVMAGEADTAFVAARPPGHHATPDTAMGFCLLNSVAIAALHAQASGAGRVAVVDFDVHHGNGTQDILWDRPDTFFASSHEWPQYPGTGKATERGGQGEARNAPIPTGEGARAFRAAWAERLLPALDAFAPDLILVSAGFDAHEADPVGGLTLHEDDFDWITAEILGLARRHARGRVVSLLEGGYDLGALGRSAAVHVSRLARGPEAR